MYCSVCFGHARTEGAKMSGQWASFLSSMTHGGDAEEATRTAKLDQIQVFRELTL